MTEKTTHKTVFSYFFLILISFSLARFSYGEEFYRSASLVTREKVKSSPPTCSDITKAAKGKIHYSELKKSGDLGYHHCIHKPLYENDFPEAAGEDEVCIQVSMNPEPIKISPPLPHSGNKYIPGNHRANPYYVKEGSSCQVLYTQYYYRP